MHRILDSIGLEEIFPININAREVTIDLRHIMWVYPHGIIGLKLLIKYRIKRGLRTNIFLPDNFDILSYLERMGVFEDLIDSVCFEPSIDHLLGHEHYERDTMHELTEIRNRKEIPKLVEKFVSCARDQKGLNNDDERNLRSGLVELLQNMPDHANPFTPDDFIGYANLQTYDKKNRIYISIGDVGVGILRSLMTREDLRHKMWKDEEAIKIVMTERLSRFRDERFRTRGGGIKDAVSNVLNLGAYLLIRSGSGAVARHPNGHFISTTELKYFPGTQILIVLSKN